MEFRHELKYTLNFLDYMEIRQRLRAVFPADEHTNEKGEYFIRSLYFDNPEDKALREKLDGVNKREKFRLRYYNFDVSQIQLEKKSKINGLCNKRQSTVSKEQVQSLLDGKLDWMSQSGDELLTELYSKINSQQLRPKTIVDYTREPFVFAPGNVRITLDRGIRTGLNSTDFLNPGVPTVSAGEPVIILEVKFDEFLPQLVRDVVQLNSRRASAFSKYGVCRIYG